MNRDQCASCTSTDLIPILDLGESPLADEFPSADIDWTHQQLDTTYPLRLLICATCSLVQLEHVVPDETLYGGQYAFHSSTSPALVAYHRDLATLIRDRYDLRHKLVVEIGCNDGSLLQHLTFAGQAIGVDPAPGPTQAARERGLKVHNEAFSNAAGRVLADSYGYADLIVANNVAAHVADLNDFLNGIDDLMELGGRALVEVQYLPDLILGNMIDHVYHEHRYYWSLTALTAAAARHGMTITEVWQTEPQGGSIRVELAHTETGLVPSGNVEWLIDQERGWATHPDAFIGWQGRADRLRERLLALVLEHAPVVGIGAPAKATTLLSFCDIGPGLLTHVEDPAPSKIGRFMPGGQVPVRAPNPGGLDEGQVYLLLVWNYLRPILAREAAWRAAGGRMIVPIPLPVLL